MTVSKSFPKISFLKTFKLLLNKIIFVETILLYLLSWIVFPHII
jgi:hypothetical protein